MLPAQASAGLWASIEVPSEVGDYFDTSLKSCVLRRGLSPSPVRGAADLGSPLSLSAQEVLQPVDETLQRLREHFEAKQEFAKHKVCEAKSAFISAMGMVGTSPISPFTPGSVSSSLAAANAQSATPSRFLYTPVHHVLDEDGRGDFEDSDLSEGDLIEDDGCIPNDLKPADMDMHFAQVVQRLGTQLDILEDIVAVAEGTFVAPDMGTTASCRELNRSCKLSTVEN